METKFIEGTNQQYSIREDGVITKHYKRYRNQHNIGIIPMCKEYNTSGTLTKIQPEKNLIYNPQILLAKYFGFRYCKKCTNKFIEENIKCTHCNDCKRNTINAHSKKWAEMYPDKKKKSSIKSSKKIRNIMTKSYISSRLNIKVIELTEEMYIHHKKTILFQRQLAKTHNISIYSLNSLK
jgi:hypothetical protein